MKNREPRSIGEKALRMGVAIFLMWGLAGCEEGGTKKSKMDQLNDNADAQRAAASARATDTIPEGKPACVRTSNKDTHVTEYHGDCPGH